MTPEEMTMTALSLPVFVIIHGIVSYFVFSFAFGAGEAGNTAEAYFLGILSLILTPFLVPAFMLFPEAALLVGIISSSLFWWVVFILVKLSLLEFEARVDAQAEQKPVAKK